MATAIIYAKGLTEGSQFHLVSSWTYDNGKLSGPTVASTTLDYDFSSIPAGSNINRVDAYALVGKRFTPISGLASGFPKANSMQMFRESEGSNLYIAEGVISDISMTTKVTYSFKASGNESSGSGSISFDDVHLVVDYSPPCSDWFLDHDSYSATGDITGQIVATEENATYTHHLSISFGDTV